MLIYWSLFVILAAGTMLSQAGDARRPWFFLVAFVSVPTALMIGVRWKIGPDWVGYVEIFKYTQLFTFKQALLHFDPAFFLMYWETGHLGAPFWVTNVFCGVVFVYGLTAFCLRQPNPWLTYLLALPYLVIVIGMSGARQSVALGFLFLALNAFEDGKLMRVAVLTVVGALFHSSLLLMLPLLLISCDRKSVQRAAIVCLIVIVFIFEFQSTFSIYVSRYSSIRIQSGGLVYRLAMNALAAAAYFVFRNKLGFPEHQRRLWRNFSICTLALVGLALVIPSSTAVDRFLLYLFPLQFAVLGRLPRAIVPNRGLSFATVAVIAYAAAVQIMFLNFGTYSNYYVPYQSIFDV